MLLSSLLIILEIFHNLYEIADSRVGTLAESWQNLRLGLCQEDKKR